MVSTLPEEQAVDTQEDYEFAASDASGQSDEELIPPGRYKGAFVGFKIEDKPEWKIESQRQRYPDKEPKLKQAQWMFELVEEGYEGRKLSDWQDVSWHVKSNGGKYLAALLGKARLDGTERGRIKQYIGTVISLRITEFKGRNYIDPNGCEPISPRKSAKDADSPTSLLERLNTAMAECHMSRGELLAEWGKAGLEGKTREGLSPSEMGKAIKHFEQIAAGLKQVASLPF